MRAELHVHLDGSITSEAVWEACQARRLELEPGAGPPRTVADVARHLAALTAFRRFDVVNDVVGGNATSIRRVAEAFVAFQARSGVSYTEVRYDPVRLARSALANTSISEEAAVAAVQEGLAAGASRHNVTVYQLLCAMRGQSPESCFRTAELAARMRSPLMGGVVGLDLAGDETKFPNGPYVACFQHAKRALGLNTTVHAGEFASTTFQEVRQAVLEMEVDRIGHGYQAVEDAATLSLLRERGVHLEACPKSARGHGLLASLAVFRSARLSFGLNTDDPADWIGNTTAAEDEALVVEGLNFTSEDLEGAYAAARGAAFGVVDPPGPAVAASLSVDAGDDVARWFV